ncbi:MAG: alpha/beta hydrolase-fold protein [Anaerolineales bacterium]|jgi:enterochelin esterase family protein
MPAALLERAQKSGTPIIEENQAIFVWKGEKPPTLIGDFTDWENGKPAELYQVGLDLWGYRLQLPPDAYIEYCFQQGDKRLVDVFNRYSISNGVGGRNNYFYMPDGRPTVLVRRKRGISGGEVTRVDLQTGLLMSGRKRAVYFYQPATDQPSPLFVVWDGLEFLKRARLVTIIDNLIEQKRMTPVALAMVPNGGRSRMSEYACNEATIGFLMDFVLPVAIERLNLIDVDSRPGAYGIMGASMGGLMALYTALRQPQVFGKVLSQSGAFAYMDHELVVFDLVRDANPKPLDIWMNVGQYDFPTLLTANRQMYKLLSKKGYQVSYQEYNGGHNYTAWRNNLWRGLEYLYPHPRDLES